MDQVTIIGIVVALLEQRIEMLIEKLQSKITKSRGKKE